MIDEFISAEIRYFEPMLARARCASEGQRVAWRSETVSQRTERVSLETWEMCEGTVQYGPFKGMRLSNKTWWEQAHLGAQCMGLYEKEILDFIESVPTGHFDSFIDIGAADGYYAVGMLLSGIVKKSTCFEIAEQGQEAIKRNWALNGTVGQLNVYGEADQHSLRREIANSQGQSLMLIDIEGGEFDLLTPSVIEVIQDAQVLLEVHNWVDNFLEKYTELLRNLAHHFNIEVLPRSERPTFQFDELRGYTDDNRLLLVSERRPCVMRFLKLTPLNAV